MMEPLSTLRTVFSLDTLDTRLVSESVHTSSPPRDPTAPRLGESNSGHQQNDTNSSRWKTPEFAFYFVVFALVVPAMFKAASDLSQESHPNFKIYKPLLQQGWILGRRVDNSDQQYASFRNNLPILIGVCALQFVLRRGYEFVFSRILPTPPSASQYAPRHRLLKRKIFDILFALVFLFVLHGLSLIKILFIIVANFSISFFHPASIWVPVLTWVFNLGVLFANERYRGYKFSEILPWLIAGEGSGFGYAMDHFMGGGILNRWEVSFNITVLRMISYNLDHYWAAVQQESGDEPEEEGAVIEVGGLTNDGFAATGDEELGRASGAGHGPEEEERLMMNLVVKKKQTDPANLNERDRVTTPARIEDYSLLNYIAYVLYTPLYLAGPIITFNDFVHQQKYSSPSLKIRRTFLYGLRLAISILVMEIMLHIFYVVAISKTGAYGSWAGATPFQLAMLGYFNLHIIWLKLMIPWRFFRFWALVDGVDPVENMLRCMSNNYSALLFWRSWHRSFNRWTVRYIYIPIGGARRPLVNMLAVFTFVALWHDISMKLLVWGWLIVLFVAPEIFAKKLFKRERFGDHATLHRMLCGVGSVGNVLMMMVANLIGFAIGVDGMKDMIHGILGTWNGTVFMMIACCSIFVAIQVMYELREHEKRHGIDLRC